LLKRPRLNPAGQIFFWKFLFFRGIGLPGSLAHPARVQVLATRSAPILGADGRQALFQFFDPLTKMKKGAIVCQFFYVISTCCTVLAVVEAGVTSTALIVDCVCQLRNFGRHGGREEQRLTFRGNFAMIFSHHG